MVAAQPPVARAAPVKDEYSDGEWEEDDGRSYHTDEDTHSTNCSGSGHDSDNSDSDDEGSEGYRKGACACGGAGWLPLRAMFGSGRAERGPVMLWDATSCRNAAPLSSSRWV